MAFYHALNLIGEFYDNAEEFFKGHASDLIRSDGFNVEQEPQEFWVRPRAKDQVKAV